MLDVRQRHEYFDSCIPGAVNIPLHELLDQLDDVPLGRVWVHCASGYRSSIAASLIDSPDRIVVLIDDDYDSAQKLGLTS